MASTCINPFVGMGIPSYLRIKIKMSIAAEIPIARSRILVESLIAAGSLFIFRFVLIWRETHAFPQWQPSLPATFVNSVYVFGGDALAVALVTASTLILAALAPRLARHAAFACFSLMLLASASSVHVALLYSRPLSLNLIKFASLDNLGGVPTVLGYADSWDFALLGLAWVGIAAMIAVPKFVSHGIHGSWAFRAACALGLFAVAIVTTIPYAEQGRAFRIKNANAAVFLVGSAISPSKGVEVVETPDMDDPFSVVVDSGLPISQESAPIENVVIIVLESVGSAYADIDKFPQRMPNLAGLRHQMALFPNSYAPMPSSAVSLFSLLSSLYPPPSPDFMSDEVSNSRAIPTLLSLARQSGRRTALFASATWEYTGAGSFVRSNGAMLMQEPAQRVCPGDPGAQLRRTETPDACTFSAMQNWIAASPLPYVAMIWTDETHYPYLGAGRTNDDQGSSDSVATREMRYLHRLRETDRKIGRLVTWLNRRGELDRTLIVIVGDHGEAFGQHSNAVHGGDLYEETTRVPFMLLNRRLFSGARDEAPVRLIDVAPTILKAIGVQPPNSFQGLNLFDRERPRFVFLSAPWVGMTLAYREQARKYIYRWAEDDLVAFDLSVDPDEKYPLELSKGEAARARWRMANWASVAVRRIDAAERRSNHGEQ